jgi:DNA-binding GntR family transcriptional regulator
MRATEARNRVHNLRRLRHATEAAERACATVLRIAGQIRPSIVTAPFPKHLREQIMGICKTNKTGVTITEIATITGASAVQIRWALRQLRKSNQVEMRGHARGAFYVWCA